MTDFWAWPLAEMYRWREKTSARFGGLSFFAPVTIAAMLLVVPMPLQRRRDAFDDPNWIFELKYDGFRALAHVDHGRGRLVSRNGHPFTSFTELADCIGTALRHTREAVIDGEIVCLDRRGHSQFNKLLFRRDTPCFSAFDLLFCDGKDWRRNTLMERKTELRRVLRGTPDALLYVDHIEGNGTALFERICELDLEGIVAKYKHGPYVSEREQSTWFKIRNPRYSQMIGRAELFERDRHREPVPGWHTCELACAAVFNK